MSLLSPNLQAFIAIVQQNTVHGAAEKLGLSQTAVTQRIRSLERELDRTLFQRSRKGMLLTHEGQALYNYCLRAQEIEGETLAILSSSGTAQDVDVTVVGPTSTLVTRIEKQCTELYKKYPNLNLHFIFDDHKNLISYLKNGLAQFAILQKHQVTNELDSKIIESEKFVLVGPASWKKRSLKDILNNERMIDFFEDDQTTLNYLRSYNLLDEISRSRLFVNNNKSLIDLVIAGVGYATLTKKIAAPYVKDKKMVILNSSKSLDVDIALAWYPRPESPEYFKGIIKTIK